MFILYNSFLDSVNIREKQHLTNELPRRKQRGISANRNLLRTTHNEAPQGAEYCTQHTEPGKAVQCENKFLFLLQMQAYLTVQFLHMTLRGNLMLIKNAHVIDPSTSTDMVADILIDRGKVTGIGNFETSADKIVFDASGLVASPGLVDMHVHLRDPGFTYKEDIASGAAAAAAGGFTSIACMPNTSPVIDTPDLVRYIIQKGGETPVKILPIGAVTVGQAGEKLTDMTALKQAGVVALSDDGVPIDRAVIARNAMQKAKEAGLPIISHCEDGEMVKNHAVNEGAISQRLSLPGRPAIAEELMVARDILLSMESGAKLHVAHVSTKGSVELIRMAKTAGIPITAETCPQYFTLTEQSILAKGSLARVNPPLRTGEDVAAITKALCDGVIDAIVTDHAPHSDDEKSRPLPDAPSGMVGLETSLGLVLTMLYHTGRMGLSDIITRMSTSPRSILGLPPGLAPGSPADITLFDPHAVWIVSPDEFLSKGRNTPFGGMELRGMNRYTIVDGNIVFAYQS